MYISISHNELGDYFLVRRTNGKLTLGKIAGGVIGSDNKLVYVVRFEEYQKYIPTEIVERLPDDEFQKMIAPYLIKVIKNLPIKSS